MNENMILNFENNNEAEIMAKALIIAQKTLEKKDELIENLTPKANQCDDFINGNGVHTPTQTTKELANINEILILNFENNEVKIINDNGKPLFEIYSTGMALGYKNKRKNSIGKEYISPYKSRIDKAIKNAEISTIIYNEQQYIDLESLRIFISITYTKKKTDFIIWLKEKGFISYNEVFDSTRKEIIFIKELENALKNFNIKGIKQYKILNYRIDYYIPKLNIAIEYDEDNHNNYTYEQHEGRQEEIEKELHCKFIRVSDKNNLGYNIGYVIKEIFNINI